MLSKLTPQLKYVFRELERLDGDDREGAGGGSAPLQDSPRSFMQELTDFMVALQPRGILTCLGVRHTNSSVDTELPPEKN
mmetsp:Transcript_41573/g.54745  ORF Transcript_41573/g.54745 Transcript_41573/m.54745 type:complete len:80 (+) Transcript_41573:451-690(+)